MIDDGDNTYGGKYVVNPSGGLISKGHPLGATGLAQCAELCWQVGRRRRGGAGAGSAMCGRHASHVWPHTCAGDVGGVLRTAYSGHPSVCLESNAARLPSVT